jgi:hypothetical protein
MADQHPKTLLQLRREVYEQLLVWLRRHSRRRFLDKPIVLTILVGLLAGALTIYWQTSEQRREVELIYRRAVADEQIALIKEFSGVYVNIAAALDGWFTRVLWIADVSNEPFTPEIQRNLLRWKEQVQKLEERYAAAPPLDGVLSRVAVLYRCPAVRETVAELRKDWHGYREAFQAFNRRSSERPELPQEEIDRAEASRRQMQQRLEDLSEQLNRRMGGEIAAARDGVAACP